MRLPRKLRWTRASGLRCQNAARERKREMRRWSEDLRRINGEKTAYLKKTAELQVCRFISRKTRRTERRTRGDAAERDANDAEAMQVIFLIVTLALCANNVLCESSLNTALFRWYLKVWVTISFTFLFEDKELYYSSRYFTVNSMPIYRTEINIYISLMRDIYRTCVKIYINFCLTNWHNSL